MLEERVTNAGSLSFVEQQLTLSIVYQSAYGIFNHHAASSEKEKRLLPLKVIAMHDKENIVDMDRRQNLKRRFANSNVLKYYGLNWGDFIEYPTEECEDFIALSEECTRRDTKILKDNLPDR